MTFVKTKIELAKLKAGDTLEVLLSEGEPLENVPRTSREQGYDVLGIEPAGDRIYKVIIQK
jgi:TusA-related sulfurtransferase